MIHLSVFDLETTGLDKHTCEIIEVGVIEYEGWDIVGEHNWLVNIGKKLPPIITEITGITDSMLRSRGRPWSRVAPEVWSIMSKSDIWCAHNDLFDVGFLQEHLRPMVPDYKEPVRVDTLRLADRWLPKSELKSRKLTSIAEYFGHRFQNAHRATDDARATGVVLKMMCEKFGVTLEDLASDEPLPLGKFMRVEDPFEATILGSPSPYGRERNY